MLQRAIRAARLDVDLYETVEADSGYTGEAAIIVAITALLAGIGAALGSADTVNIIGTVIGSMVGWLVWAGVTLIVGTKVFDGTATFGEMARVLGFASAPRALAVVPVIGALVGGIWMLIAGVVAVRQGLDFDTGKAIGTVIVGAIAYIILASIFAIL